MLSIKKRWGYKTKADNDRKKENTRAENKVKSEVHGGLFEGTGHVYAHPLGIRENAEIAILCRGSGPA